MDNTQNHEELSDELPYTIDFFTPADAPGVVALFRAVYGENYPVKEVYDPVALMNQEKTGDAYRLVARAPSNEVVGHISIYRSSPPNPLLYEAGCLMIRHDYRQTDLSFTLFSALSTHLISKYTIRYIWGEAVCNHLFTQQSVFREGFIETALEMDLMPASSYAAPGSQSIGGRVSALTVFRLIDYLPQKIYVPSCYDETIRFLYAPIGDGCTFIRSDAPLPSGDTVGTVQTFSEAGVARFTIDAVGTDFGPWIERNCMLAEKQGAQVIQFFIRMNTPAIGVVTDILQRNRFFIGGILPCWFGEDGFLMQKRIGTPFFEGTHVYTKRAGKIKEIVQNDWDVRR